MKYDKRNRIRREDLSFPGERIVAVKIKMAREVTREGGGKKGEVMCRKHSDMMRTS